MPIRMKMPIGKTIGAWTILERVHHPVKTNDIHWLCRCKCGIVKAVNGSSLRGGQSRSCWKCSSQPRPYGKGIPAPFWNRIKKNASKRSIRVHITTNYAYSIFLKQRGKCALSGLKIAFPKHGTELLKGISTASLDRIDSKKGYVRGNLQWVHKDVNLMKNVLNSSRFVELCVLVAKKSLGLRLTYEDRRKRSGLQRGRTGRTGDGLLLEGSKEYDEADRVLVIGVDARAPH